MALPQVSSDHNPILLESSVLSRGPTPFWFEEMWLQALDFLEMVSHRWNRMIFVRNPNKFFVLKLKGLKEVLKIWNKDSCSSLKTEIERIRKNISKLDRLEEDGNLSWDDQVCREALRKDF